MKIDLEALVASDSVENPRLANQRGTVCFRGALRSQVRLPGRSKRIRPAFRKQWSQTASFSSSHSE
ncbi:MAG TPA: hypothetical protein VFZ59_22935 [Verrucomicrobiae bacterium]|nr:hypothetical protein [Verrucomicrobiae bacterium]